jgi:hypothetical protein
MEFIVLLLLLLLLLLLPPNGRHWPHARGGSTVV